MKFSSKQRRAFSSFLQAGKQGNGQHSGPFLEEGEFIEGETYLQEKVADFEIRRRRRLRGFDIEQIVSGDVVKETRINNFEDTYSQKYGFEKQEEKKDREDPVLNDLVEKLKDMGPF